MKIYYAHHIWKYGTKIEEYELNLIKRDFPDSFILNPNNGLGYTENSQLSDAEIMENCFAAIKESDAIAFSSVSGMVGRGVVQEVNLVKELNLTIYYIDGNRTRSVSNCSFDIISGSDTQRIYAIIRFGSSGR